MFGFGVGFGTVEFGSAGFAIEADDPQVAISGDSEMTADATLVPRSTAAMQVAAVGGLSIDPVGIAITRKPRSGEESPDRVPARIAAQKIERPAPITPESPITFTIGSRRRRERER